MVCVTPLTCTFLRLQDTHHVTQTKSHIALVNIAAACGMCHTPRRECCQAAACQGAVQLLSCLLCDRPGCVSLWCCSAAVPCSWPWPGSDAATAEAEGAPAKLAAADVLSALLAQPTHGPRVGLLLGKLLPPGLVASIADGPPEAVLRALGQVQGDAECGVHFGQIQLTLRHSVNCLTCWGLYSPGAYKALTLAE